MGRAILAGVLGTLAMSVIGLFAAPMMGLPAMNPAEMLAGRMGGILMLGWAGHFMIGIVLAVIYAKVMFRYLPGPPVVRGAIFSLLPWLVAQVMVMPMMGMPVFSGSAGLAGGSLIGHLIYGAVVGAVIGGTVDQKQT